MTQGVQDADQPRLHRWLLATCALASVVPFYVAAIRDARNGFYPTLDVGATVLRSRAVLSAHPPLVGMWSSASSWAGHEIHFPGAIQLYLLAIPTHVFGVTWGPLLGMATVNALWVLLAGWMIYRRLGTSGACIGFLVLALFVWSIGSENLIDPRPMEMVTIPFLCFLFAVWAVATDDIDMLPVLALVANYLYLDHLVLALQVPVLGLIAIAGVIRWWRNSAKQDVSARRRLRRRLLQAGGITLVMWLPSLYQEIRGNPGNLTLLVEASGHAHEPVGSLAAAYNTTIKLIAVPPFWFRGTFDRADFTDHIYHATLSTVLPGLLLFGLIFGLLIVSYRRRDRIAVGALLTAVAGIVVSMITVYQAPGGLGFPMQYLRSVWVMAAFVWFAILLGAFRALNLKYQYKLTSPIFASTLIFLALGLSYANYGSAINLDTARVARTFVAQAVPQLKGRGKVFVATPNDFVSHAYYDALLLALDVAGVPYCVTPTAAQQYGTNHSCQIRAKIAVSVYAGTKPALKGMRVLVQVPLQSKADQDALSNASATIRMWLSTRHKIRLAAPMEALLAAQSPETRAHIESILEPKDGNLVASIDDPTFVLLATIDYANRSPKSKHTPIFDEPTMPVNAFHTYYRLKSEMATQGWVWLLEPGPK